VQFDKLRLSGFKSFVDPTELAIEPGMTGIVGPNGCGKSNLVEALKWVMGETSAKQMRGSEMEDVIFSGAGTRPARNIAEVMLILDNKTRTAPAMVNDADQLDIVRRIERGHGSAYSVNGREIRARDIQTLFADAATGSRSTALVSQGRIGALIAAKPADRRTIIDEAAGITGLYARRHEAELRLRAAEQNLARVQDVLVALEEQHKGLKRQARQASRYRNLSDHIRRAEAAVLALRLARTESELTDAGERLKEAEAQVADLTRLVGLATTAQADAATALPPLRNDEATAAAALQRLRVAHDALTAEAERVASAQQEAATRLQQTEGDLTGIAAMEARNVAKARLLYDFMDGSDFYANKVDPGCRSRMNIPFFLADESRNEAFLAGAREAGLLQLKGHKSVGGMRASIYNAMPLAGVQALVGYMREFERSRA